MTPRTKTLLLWLFTLGVVLSVAGFMAFGAWRAFGLANEAVLRRIIVPAGALGAALTVIVYLQAAVRRRQAAVRVGLIALAAYLPLYLLVAGYFLLAQSAIPAQYNVYFDRLVMHTLGYLVLLALALALFPVFFLFVPKDRA